MSENGKGNRNRQGRNNSRRNKEQRKNLKFQEQKDKLDRPTKGPFTITKVYDNGTVAINRGRYTETIHIRRLKPYFTEN